MRESICQALRIARQRYAGTYVSWYNGMQITNNKSRREVL